MLCGLRSRWTMPIGVRLRHRLEHAGEDLADVVVGQLAVPALCVLLERRAVDVLHHEREQILVLDEVVDARDVAVVPAEHQLRLAPEPAADIGVAHEARVQRLDRDGALALQVGGAVDDAHAALAEHAVDLVAVGDPRAGRDQPRRQHALARIGERPTVRHRGDGDGPDGVPEAGASTARTEPSERRQGFVAGTTPFPHDPTDCTASPGEKCGDVTGRTGGRSPDLVVEPHPP